MPSVGSDLKSVPFPIDGHLDTQVRGRSIVAKMNGHVGQEFYEVPISNRFALLPQ